MGLEFNKEARKSKNKFYSFVNNEGDRAKFNFFNIYKGTNNCNFNKEEETSFTIKKKNKYIKYCKIFINLNYKNLAFTIVYLMFI